jgi:hypothetical protein
VAGAFIAWQGLADMGGYTQRHSLPASRAKGGGERLYFKSAQARWMRSHASRSKASDVA